MTDSLVNWKSARGTTAADHILVVHLFTTPLVDVIESSWTILWYLLHDPSAQPSPSHSHSSSLNHKALMLQYNTALGQLIELARRISAR